jgi:hypothetical protein
MLCTITTTMQCTMTMHLTTVSFVQRLCFAMGEWGGRADDVQVYSLLCPAVARRKKEVILVVLHGSASGACPCVSCARMQGALLFLLG